MSLIKTNIDYPGKVVLTDIAMPIFKAQDIANDLGIKVVPTMRSSYVYHNLSTSADFQAYTPEVTTPEDITLNQKNIELVSVQLPIKLNNNDLVDTCLEAEYGNASFNEESISQAQIMNAITELVVKQGSDLMAGILVNGNTAGATSTSLDLYNGLLRQFNQDAGVIDIATPVAITPANVIDELTRIYNGASNELKRRSRQDGFFAVSYNVYDSLRSALLYDALSAAGAAMDQASGIVTFLGIKVVPVAAMAPDKAFFSYSENFRLPVTAKEDELFLKVTDMSKIDAFRDVTNARLKMRFGIGYHQSAQVVAYNI